MHKVERMPIALFYIYIVIGLSHIHLGELGKIQARENTNFMLDRVHSGYLEIQYFEKLFSSGIIFRF